MAEEIEKLVRNLHAAAWTEGRADSRYASDRSIEHLNVATTQARHELLKAIAERESALTAALERERGLESKLDGAQRAIKDVQHIADGFEQQLAAANAEIGRLREALASALSTIEDLAIPADVEGLGPGIVRDCFRHIMADQKELEERIKAALAKPEKEG